MNPIIDLTIRSSLIVLVALGVRIVLARRSAALRHWVLTIGLACAAATPLLQLVLPTWDVGPVAFSSAAREPWAASDVTATVAFLPPASPERREAGPTAPQKERGRSYPVAPLLLCVWLAGALTCLSMLIAGFVRLSRVASAARPVDAGPLLAVAADVRQAMALRRPVVLLQNDDPTPPVTWGVARPKVILPDSAREWPEARARAILRHEFAHVARLDWAAQVVAETLRAVYWFNPLFWIACRRLRDEGERACDDAVLGGGVKPVEYASHLLDLARSAATRRPGPALAMARSSSLEGRVAAMLNAHTDRRPLRHAMRVATIVAFAALTVPIAVAQSRFWTFSGTVVDQTNRYVPDATLALTNESTRTKHEVRTDRAGHFEFLGLPSGSYQLAVQQPGFKTFKSEVVVAEKDVSRSIRLEIGGVHETITVSGGPTAPASDPARQATREQSRQRAQELRQRAAEKCGGGVTGGDVGGDILPPAKITDVRPEYPEALRSAGIGGVVTLDALIGTDGTVRDVTVVSSPHPDLERTAIDAVGKWEFSTTFLNCTPMALPMRVTVSFVAR